MKIGLIGYGKMGKAIERIALERGHSIVFKADSTNTLAACDLSSADVAIEFTQPLLAANHIIQCAQANLPVVVGTTAWLHDFPKVQQEVTDYEGALLYASNFSIGVNILFQINEQLAALMGKQSAYKVSIEEIHHTQKLDAPSGTAVTIAEGIIKEHGTYKEWKSETGFAPVAQDTEIPITALREPNVPGTHTITYASEIDTLTLSHVAHSRDGFALGAVLASEFLAGKKGIFTMKDVLNQTI